MWFGFSSKRLYTLSQILSQATDEDIIYIGEDEIEIRRHGTVIKAYVIYNPYGKKESYLYTEKTENKNT